MPRLLCAGCEEHLGGGGGALHCLLSPCSLVAPNMVRVIITVIIDPRTVCEVS